MDVFAEPVHWLWPGRIACGKVTIIAGHPGIGKSQISASLAAIVSTGGLWPDGDAHAELGAVAICSAEDDAADTLKPRLMAAGADMARCHVLDAVHELGRDGLPTLRGFDLSRDVSRLEATLAQLGDIRLLFIDPISAYLGGVDSHRHADVRALLAPLSDMAARLDVAVVAISHLSKGGGEAIARVTGSLAFIAAARAAWLVVKDPQHDARRLFLALKNNLGPDGSGLAFGIDAVTIGDIETSRVVWSADPVTMTADEALTAARSGREQRAAPQSDEAYAWLAQVLAKGPVPTVEIQQRARADGVSWRTVERAKDRLGVRSRRHGFGDAGRWAWELPQTP